MARGLIAFYSRAGEINQAGDTAVIPSALCYICRAHNPETAGSNAAPVTKRSTQGRFPSLNFSYPICNPIPLISNRYGLRGS